MPMTLASSITVGSGGATQIEFTNIPQDGKDLLLLISARSGVASGADGVLASIKYNNSSDSTYTTLRVFGLGTDASSTVTTNGTSTSFYRMTTPDQAASVFAVGRVYVANYAGSANKLSFSEAGFNNSNTAIDARFTFFRRANTAAITSIQITNLDNSFVQHTIASLYTVS